jgi:hypothetical protein
MRKEVSPCGMWTFFGACLPAVALAQAGCLVFGIFSLNSFSLVERAEAVTTEEDWRIQAEVDIHEWEYAGLSQGGLTTDGLQFAVKDQAAIFRALPFDFDRRIDGMKIFIGPSSLKEVVLLFMEAGAGEKILRRLRIPITPDEKSLTEGFYFPLTFYRSDLKEMNLFSLSLIGDAEQVTFGGIQLLSYSLKEKLLGVWKSFSFLEPFRPHMINVLLGPTIVPDPTLAPENRAFFPLRTSLNAYLLVLLSLVGIALLFSAAFLARVRNIPWEILRSIMLRRFFLCIAVVWVLYDIRMGIEFLHGVALDRKEYITAPRATRTFRDLGRFYDFAAFVGEHVSDRKQYELFAPDEWQYFGLMQYETYPVLPNRGDPVSDTWVVYSRSDITLGSDQRLYHVDQAFTKPGMLLDRFDDSSFIFRESAS